MHGVNEYFSYPWEAHRQVASTVIGKHLQRMIVARRYAPDPKIDENFHIKSSIFGCLFSPISNHPNLDD